MVDSYTINYGTGAIQLTLKVGMSANLNSASSDEAAASTNSTQATEQTTNPTVSTQTTGSGFGLFSNNDSADASKRQVVVKGQLADIQRFWTTLSHIRIEPRKTAILLNMI